MSTSASTHGPVIIEVALNGATTYARNPNTPQTSEAIAADAIACIEGGAAIIHNHVGVVRQGTDATVAAYLDSWRDIFVARPDALVYPTIDFQVDGLSFDHLRPLAETGLLKIGLCDPGSVNLGSTGARGPQGSFVYGNSFDFIGAALDLHAELGLGPSLAIYEPGFLRATLAFQRAGRLPRGSMAKLYFSTDRGLSGAAFGLPPTLAALDAYLELLDGSGIPWAASVAGGDVVASLVGRAAVERGGHLHIGLEFHAGDHTPTNLELLHEAVALCESVGRRVATPDEAAEILDLPRRSVSPA